MFVSDRAGKSPRRLTRTQSSCELPVGWTQDGRVIRFQYCVTGAAFEMKASGGPKRRLPSIPPGPVWSPDGRSIAYFDVAGRGLYIADGDGRNPRHIGLIQGGAVAWSPDGRTLAFQRDAREGCGAVEYRWQVFLVAAEPGSTPTPRECVAGWERTPTWQPVRR